MPDKLPNGYAIFVIFLMGANLCMFSLGMYCKEKDMKAKYYLGHCTIGDTWSCLGFGSCPTVNIEEMSNVEYIGPTTNTTK